MAISRGVRETLKDERDAARLRVAELEALINNPHTADFLEAVRLEAAHQRERWAAGHDAGKTDSDWFWLIGYLAGKALHKPEKQLHHIITTAAACLNWHMARTVGNDMRPGISQAKTSGTAPSVNTARDKPRPDTYTSDAEAKLP
jgi:hypothetical protein